MSERHGPAEARDPWSDRLSEYVDGEMAAPDRERLESHLAGCPSCAVTLAALRDVVARARALEDVPPAADLWPGIAAQLAPRGQIARSRPGTIREGGPWWMRRFDLALPQLAAAAVVLVTLSAGAVWLALRGAAPPMAPGGAGRAASVPAAAGKGPAGAVGGVSAAALEDPRYDAAVADLERTLEEGRGKLDPRTLRVIEANLQIIDRAIEDARRAVAADPGNTWLRSHLASTMKRKVDLLRSATMIAAAQS